MASLDASSEFVSQYVVELQDLTINSKVIINTLTMLASENKQAAAGIAEAIEKRITTCAPAHKLPALYLLDSIVKNVGLPYTALFARDLPEVYLSAWSTLPDSRTTLQKLYNTWHRYFPADILGSIADRVANPPAQPSTSYSGPHYSHQAATAYPMQQNNSPQRAWTAQYAQPQPQYANGQIFQQQPAGYSQSSGTFPYPQQQTYAVPVSYSTTYTPTYPQPQYAGAQPSSAGPSPAIPHHISPSYAAHNSPAYPTSQAPQSAPAAVPEFLSQLIGAGLIPAGRNPPPPESGRGAPRAEFPPTSFENMRSKETAETAVQKLLEGSKSTRAKFLDQRLHKQRKLATGTRFSRQWFTKESDWLAGTTADAEAAPAFFDTPSKEADLAAAEEEASVPADPSQPECALSGERFDSVWDEATSGWRYKGAVALDAEQAARYGLPDGALVKISCLGSPGGLELEGAAEVLQEAEGQEAADQMAAAAAEETADADAKLDQKPSEEAGVRNKRDIEEGSSASPSKRRKS